MTKESVSVVIPAYKSSGTINRALDSVFAQTILPAEVLVVDDGSPDGDELSRALQRYGIKVTLLHKSNGGAGSARNLGIEHARQEWVAFLDADDYWEPVKLELQLKVAKAHSDVNIISCRWYEEIPGKARTAVVMPTDDYFGRCLRPRGRDAFAIAMRIWTSGLLLRRSVLTDNSFVTNLETAEDRDLWIRLVSANSVYLLPELLATYVQEEGGLSRSNIDKDCSNMLKVVHRYRELLGGAGVREQEAVVYRRWAGVHMAQGRPYCALPYALRRLRLQPFSLQAWWIVMKSAVAGCVWSRR